MIVQWWATVTTIPNKLYPINVLEVKHNFHVSFTNINQRKKLKEQYKLKQLSLWTRYDRQERVEQ